MGVKLIYMDMPERVKAFSIQNDDLSYTVVINKNTGLDGSASKEICECLLGNELELKT